MNDREYRAWVKNIVVKPVLDDWFKIYSHVLKRDMLDVLIRAKCLEVVQTWALARDGREDARKVIESDEIVRLIRVANDLVEEKVSP